ncbi:hypothetical protein E2320_020640 [Naja naja]|nr:hypothetical protein E2320_020640 [Naja naja]
MDRKAKECLLMISNTDLMLCFALFFVLVSSEPVLEGSGSAGFVCKAVSIQASAAPKMVLVLFLSFLPVCNISCFPDHLPFLLAFPSSPQYKKASPVRESADGVAFGSPDGEHGTLCSSVRGMELKETYELAEKFMTKIKSVIGLRQAFLQLPYITSKASFSKKVALATLLALPAASAAFAF